MCLGLGHIANLCPTPMPPKHVRAQVNKVQKYQGMYMTMMVTPNPTVTLLRDQSVM